MHPIRARADKLSDEIIEQIAKEEGISVKKVNCVLQSLFGTIAEDIRKGDLKGTHILHLGKFLVKPYKMQKYYESQINDEYIGKEDEETNEYSPEWK